MYEIKEQLKNLKLPDICVSDGKEYFLDPVRDKMILKTPEEENPAGDNTIFVKGDSCAI